MGGNNDSTKTKYTINILILAILFQTVLNAQTWDVKSMNINLFGINDLIEKRNQN